MRYLFLILFIFGFNNQALSAPPPGLFDDTVPPSVPVAKQPVSRNLPPKKSVKRKPKDNFPSIIIPKNDNKRSFVKSEDAPLFFEDENKNPEDDSIIPDFEIDKIVDVEKLKGYVNKVINKDDNENQDKKTVSNENNENNENTSVNKNDAEIKQVEKEKKITPSSFKVPQDLKKSDDNGSFLDNLFENISNVKPKDKKLEALKAKEEEKRKQQEIEKKAKDELEKQELLKQQELLKAKDELEKKKTLKPVKKKTKNEVLADKVRSFSVAGFNLGMSPKEVLDFAKLTDFKLNLITKEIPKFLMWRYEQNCKNEQKYTSKQVEECIRQKSDTDKSEYISKITLEHKDKSENITLLFSTNYSKNSLYKILYKTNGDNSLGNSSKDNFIRDQRKLDFLRRVRQRYGDPDDRANMVWGSLKNGVTLKAFITDFDVDGNVIIEDLNILDDDYITMKRASNKIKRENNFSF